MDDMQLLNLLANSEKKRKGKYLNGINRESKQYHLLFTIYISLVTIQELPDIWKSKLLLKYIIPGADVTSVVALMVLIGMCVTVSFRPDWTWKKDYLQSGLVLYIVIIGILLLNDVKF